MEDEDIKFSKRIMILILKSNQGSIPKVFYIFDSLDPQPLFLYCCALFSYSN